MFNALAAGGAGVFLLRIEDTDRERSKDEYTEALMEDLRWLGIPWNEGPEAGGRRGPYAQAARGEIYGHHYAALEAAGRVYPCFCSEASLKLSRKLQRSAGQAPRYAGTCAHLRPEEVQAKLDQGLEPTLRFRVPAGRVIEFEDLVRGPQRFASDDIGDFIIRRADGTPAFFFTNALDDALMGVSHVLRGEDHLTNTPRQLLILEALGLGAPRYGHISMIVGPDGSPLSKRHGSRSLRELRSEGYLPAAVVNYLARLGHRYENEAEFMDVAALAAGFKLENLGRAPARYDEHQLLHWQHEAVGRLSDEALWVWLGAQIESLVPAAARPAFLALIRPNVVFPGDARRWAEVLFSEPLVCSAEAEAALAAAGGEFFREALTAWESCGNDFKCLSKAVQAATGLKGKALFMPLRAALSGEVHGPQLGELVALLSPEQVRARLAALV